MGTVTKGSSTSADLVGRASTFVSGLTQYLENGVGAWTEEKERERRQREAESSPSLGCHAKKKHKDENEAAKIELEANVKHMAGSLIMTMMQSGGTFLEEQHQLVLARMEKSEQAIDDGNVRISHLENRHEQREKAVESLVQDMKDLRLENQKLKEELHVQAAWRPTSSGPPAANTASAPRPAPTANSLVYELPVTPYSLTPTSERKEATMGNLGWDTDKDTLLANCREILLVANVDPVTFNPPLTDRGFGSQASIVFKSASERREAESRVRELRRILPELALHPNANHEKPYVWMSAKKTKDELLTGRILGQSSVAIKDMESRLDNQTSNGWQLIGGPLFSEWKLCNGPARHTLVTVTGKQIRWFLFAKKRYEEVEDLLLVSEWAFGRSARRM